MLLKLLKVSWNCSVQHVRVSSQRGRCNVEIVISRGCGTVCAAAAEKGPGNLIIGADLQVGPRGFHTRLRAAIRQRLALYQPFQQCIRERLRKTARDTKMMLLLRLH